ncbi:MAG: hypothetical protein JWR66_165 [Modestobacter sp.]|jgi:hypothetical protein|nr:hypothetical protein [Modestobacter sp.]
MDGRPVDTRRYTRLERVEYAPPPCPTCGAGSIPTWLDSGDSDQPERSFRVIHLFCPANCESA